MSKGTAPAARQLYRIWIAESPRWMPADWDDVPPECVALEVADPGCFSSAQAESFLQGFNGQMLGTRRRLWAVAVPVQIRYEGDLKKGQMLRAAEILKPAARAV